MNYIEGRIFRDPYVPEINPKDRKQIYENMNKTIAQLHEINYQ